MTVIPPTASHPSFSRTPRSLGSPGVRATLTVRATLALGVVLLAVVSWSAAGGHLATDIPASLVVFLTMTLVALAGAVVLVKLQGRTGPGHRSSI